MKTLRVIFSLLLLFSFSVSHSQIVTLTSDVPVDKNVRIGKLPNGMTYYIRKNTKPEHRCELRLVVNAGSMMETQNQQGLAHLLEHMCFNGTSNFNKSELVDYLESIGTRFGADLNAYTSFDETVYMLQLPTDTEKIFNKGFQILEDWAHLVTLDSKEIDKERGVVVEEWRLGQGANERMSRKYFPVLLNQSRYADRIPIGKKEIIETAPYDTLRNFYKTWYRPDLMAVVVVGDVDVDKIEGMIKSHFSGIQNPTNEKPRFTSTVPDHNDLKVSICTDKEASYTLAEVYFKTPVPSEKTVGDYRNSIIAGLATSMLNDRYQELLQSNNPPFSFAGSSYGSFVRAVNAFDIYCVTPDNGIETGLKSILTEIKRVKDFGFTQSELDRAKTSTLRGYETSFNEKDKTESRSLVREYVSNFLEQEPIPGIEWEYQASQKLIPGITLEEVNAMIKSWITDGKNCVVIVTAPEKTGTTVPTEQQVKDIFTSTNQMKLEAYQDKVSDKKITDAVPAAGKVVKEETLNADYNIQQWTLSNGAKVIYRQTDFKNDEILFNAYSWGGTSLYGDKDFINADNCTDVVSSCGLGNYDPVELSKYESNMVMQLNPTVGELTEGFDGSSSVKDLENLLQFVNLYFTQPRKDSTAFNSFISQTRTSLQNRNNNPQALFSDTLTAALYSNNYRYQPFTDVKLNQIKLSESYDLFRQRFSDPADFTFVFVGSINADNLKVLVEKYIASIPTSGKKENYKDNGIKYGTSFTKKVYKGTEPKSTVAMVFTGSFEYNRANRTDMNAFIKLLNIKLRETLREDMSGVYGVSASPQLVHYPNSMYRIIISFSCSPDNVDTLMGAALKVINTIKTDGCDDKNLLKVKELMLKEREANLKENRFWLSLIVASQKDGENISEIKNYEDQVNALNSDKFKALAAKYFDMKTLGKVILYPEK